MYTLKDFINSDWLEPKNLTNKYTEASPFPHIVMKNFINNDLLDPVLNEFPDLSKNSIDSTRFNNEKEIKLASKGMGHLSPAAFHLISFLNSGIFLKYLQTITSIKEKLISDPYLLGGGYHEIKSGGLLKVHSDYSEHSPGMKLDRRLNLLIYLNKNWEKKWGGEISLFDNEINPVVSVSPNFNTALLFTTTSKTYHGLPDALACPKDRSRKSLALYYFSTGRPVGEIIGKRHGSIFKKRKGEKFSIPNLTRIKRIAIDFCPPIIFRVLVKIRDSIFYNK